MCGLVLKMGNLRIEYVVDINNRGGYINSNTDSDASTLKFNGSIDRHSSHFPSRLSLLLNRP